MISNVIKRFLKSRGYIIAKGPKIDERNLDGVFLAAVIKSINEYCNENPTYSWANKKEIRKYLTDDRIFLYQKLVKICADTGMDFKGKRIADFGAGMCVLHRRIAMKYSPECLDAFDNFAELRDLALTISPSSSFSSENLSSVKKKYDYIFCMEVLEHMVDPKATILHMHSLLNKGGRLILSVPNGRYDFQEAGEIREDRDSYWGHVHFWSPESWALFIKNISATFSNCKTGSITEKHIYAIIPKES